MVLVSSGMGCLTLSLIGKISQIWNSETGNSAIQQTERLTLKSMCGIRTSPRPPGNRGGKNG